MLTLSERWLTTQASRFVRAATATGSRPTGTETRCLRSPSCLTSYTSNLASGVLVASKSFLSGVNASGRTCPLSKVVKAWLYGLVLGMLCALPPDCAASVAQVSTSPPSATPRTARQGKVVVKGTRRRFIRVPLHTGALLCLG